MKPRTAGAALALVFSCLTLAGCELLHHNLRENDRDGEVKHASGETADDATDKVLDVQADPKKGKSFFRPSRLSSGLSSEAREIENDLGIH